MYSQCAVMTGVHRNSGNTQSFSLTAGSAPRYAKEMVNHRPIVMAEPWPLSWLPLFYIIRNSDQCPALMVTVQVVTPVTLVSIVTLVAFVPVMFIVTGSFATRRAATTTLNGWRPGCYIPTPECRPGRLRLTMVYAAAISSCRQREC